MLAAPAPAPDSAAGPNVLLIIADDLNTRIGPYAPPHIPVHTPNLDSLAARGVTFTRAYAQFPVCGPSRASILSGMYPESIGVTTNGFENANHKTTPGLVEHPSLPQLFRDEGYYTARVSKIWHMGVPGGIERGESGSDDPDAWDFAVNLTAPETLTPGTLETLSRGPHYGSNFARMVLPDGDESTQADVLAANQAIAIIQSRTGRIPDGATNRTRLKPDAPFFLAVGLVRPHVPLIYPERHARMHPDADAPLPHVPAGDLRDVPTQAQRMSNARRYRMSEPEQRKAVAAYHASVSFMDEQVGRILRALEQSGQAGNTLIVFVSDHGFNLGEHSAWQKLSLWEDATRVPLIVAGPAVGQGRAEGITELIDLYATIAAAAGLDASETVQGRDFSHALQAPGSHGGGEAYIITNGGAALRTDRYRYSRWGDAPGAENEELYDHFNDPGEFTNLARHPAAQATLDSLRTRFDAKRAAVRAHGARYGVR